MGEGELGSIDLGGAGVPVNMADVELWVSALPQSIRAMLAIGPVDVEGDHTHPCCTVCRVVTYLDAQGRALAHADMLDLWHHTKETNDVRSYLRCLLIYLCAGWDGTHHERDVCLGCSRCLKYWPIDSMEANEPCTECGGFVDVVEFATVDGEQRVVWASP